MKELFLAIYFNDVDKLIEIKNQYPEIYNHKNKFMIEEYTYFDLRYLTLFNYIIWFDDDWSDKILPFVERQRAKTQQMIDFWTSENEPINLDERFEYNEYCDYFLCEYPDNYDEVICDSFSYFLEKGFKEIDLKLYNRTDAFDFESVETLLKQGANQNIDFYNDGDSNTYSLIINRVSFNFQFNFHPNFLCFEDDGYHIDKDIKRAFGDIIATSANTEMLKLLDKYSEEE